MSDLNGEGPTKAPTCCHRIDITGHQIIQHSIHANVVQNCPVVVHRVGPHHFNFSLLSPILKVLHLKTNLALIEGVNT
jgi:hypothetical protein